MPSSLTVDGILLSSASWEVAGMPVPTQAAKERGQAESHGCSEEGIPPRAPSDFLQTPVEPRVEGPGHSGSEPLWFWATKNH